MLKIFVYSYVAQQELTNQDHLNKWFWTNPIKQNKICQIVLVL